MLVAGWSWIQRRLAILAVLIRGGANAPKPRLRSTEIPFAYGITMLYFSYGSNMSFLRISRRAPSAKKLDTATLRGHRLRFHKHSRVDGSAKCDAYETGNPADFVIGVIWEIAEPEKGYLDRCEGLGYGYDQKAVEVEMANGERIHAFTYCATEVDSNLAPYHWYKEHVRVGAQEHGLPAVYVTEHIESAPSIPDPDAAREADELSIYRG